MLFIISTDNMGNYEFKPTDDIDYFGMPLYNAKVRLAKKSPKKTIKQPKRKIYYAIYPK